METKQIALKEKRIAPVLIIILLTIGIISLYLNMGIVPVIIVGLSGIVAFLFWYFFYLKNPTDPAMILPPFLVCIAGFGFHLIEEYWGHYAPAISRLFNIGWTDQYFVIICFILLGAMSLISVGLFYRKSVAGFVAILFLVTRLAEFGLFIFPFISPALQPDVKGSISQTASGIFVANMPNYYYHTIGNYYFPGLYTVVLPIVPAIFTLYRIWKNRLHITG